MPRKRKTLSFSEKLQKTIDKTNKRAHNNMALFRAEQRRQGKKGNEPISLMDMVK